MLTFAAIVHLAGSPLLSFDAAELPYFNHKVLTIHPQAIATMNRAPFPRELGEKLLTQEIKALGADTVIVKN